MSALPHRRLTYSPATRAMQRLFAAHAAAARSGKPIDEILGEAEERDRAARASEPGSGPGRRTILGAAAGAGAALALGAASTAAPAQAATSHTAGAPRIAIVGAGLAGLRCAHLLWTGNSPKGPLASTVYEADTTHLGGRCWSLRGFFSNGLVGEHGGAFINSDQKTTLDLVSKLGLSTEIVNAGDLPTGQEIYWFDNAPYTYSEAESDWKNIGYPAFNSAGKAAPWPQTYNNSTAAGRQLDRQTVPQWLDSTGIGSSSRFGRLMLANAVSEYGGDPDQQSALNLVYLLYANPQNSLSPLPGYDEYYHVVGGNDQIVSRMAAQLPSGTVQQGYELVALALNSDGSYTLNFQQPGRSSTTPVVADHVVLALPFTKLRQVDLGKSGLSAFKLQVINAQRLGTNAKIHVELGRKTWPPLGYSGVTYTDWTGFDTAWDDSVPLGPNGAPAILLGFPGGSTGANTLTGAAHGTAPAADVSWFLNQIEPIFPGTQQAYTGTAYEDRWAVDPWHLGAYSSNPPGYYTAMFGYEQVQEGRVHFAGEHCSVQNQGFLDGGVETGEAAANEILSQV